MCCSVEYFAVVTLAFVAVFKYEMASAFTSNKVASGSPVSFRHSGLHEGNAKASCITACKISNISKAKRSNLSYGERSRPLRRDVYEYADWPRHRSSDRFVVNFLDVYKSGLVQQVLKEVYLTMGAATFICLYNALLVNGYDDFSGLYHEPLANFYVFAIPSVFFSLTSPALSLLLGKSHCQTFHYRT